MKASSKVVRFLAKLWADKLALLVELANRHAHGGKMREPDGPLALRDYEHAAGRLLAAEEEADARADAPAPVVKRPRQN